MPERMKGEHVEDYKIRVAQTDLLERGLVFADQFINRQYMVGLPMYEVESDSVKAYNSLRMYHISKLVYETEEELYDKLISLYGALNSIQSTAILMLKSNEDGVEVYLGTNCKHNPSTAGSILEAGIKGNFTGSEYEPLVNTQIQQLLSKPLSVGNKPCVSTVTLVPSLRDDEKEHTVQGIEKLMDALSGKEFTAILIAEPMHPGDIEVQKRGLEEMYSTISPFSETSLAYGSNSSYAVAEGTFSSFAKALNTGVTNTNSESVSKSSTSGTSSSSGSSFGGDGASFSGSSGSSYSETYGSSTSWSKAVTSGETNTTSSGTNQTITNTIGESRTLTIKHVNKSVNEVMKKIDMQLERIRSCESFGLWSVAAYFISDDVQVSAIAASTFRSLVAGDTSYMDKALINIWDSLNEYTPIVLEAITHGRHPRVVVPRMNEFNEQKVKPAVLVSGKELPIFMSLPRKSLPGTLVDYMASFGRSVHNPYASDKHEHIKLGCVRHKGVANENIHVNLDVEELRAHCFITGSTGSGKSNTTYHLLNELVNLDKKFLVIEPAKGEYKHAFGGLNGINIFWTNPKQYRLLHLNPFSFPDNIHVLEHMDRLIEILNVCWPLYSAMPAILKAAIERAYAMCGWDLANSIRIDNGKSVFPTFNDLLRELPQVINESSYSADAKGDYTGALVTRVASLTNGIMGSIFCSDQELSDEVLFDQNTIVDLSRVGSSETKAMMMGVLVMKLNEYRMSSRSNMNSKLKHITVIEEAHNLLKRANGGASELAAKSVEMISNSIAEMRTYGEGFFMEEAHDNGKYNTVIAIATQFIEAGKADLKVYRILAFSYAENGESAKSISTLNDMVTAMPDDLDAHFLYAFTMLRLFKNKESEARASIDFLLQNQNPVSPAVAALDVEYYIDCGDFALANAKTEEYRAIVGHDKSFSESIGRAYRQLAESYWEEYGGDIYIDNKENYENWKKYSELSLSVYPDVEYQKLFKSNMKVVGGITLFKENFSGILFSLILGLALTPGGGSSSFVGVLFILAFGFISVFSVVPKWMDHRYDYIGKLPGLYEVARHVAKVVGAIFNAIVWLVKTIIALILSFF